MRPNAKLLPNILKYIPKRRVERKLSMFHFGTNCPDGKSYKTKTYNLDAIISVGYRVNSKNATLFRRWASQVLKDYLLKGHVINQRISNLEQRVDAKFLSYDMQLTRLNEKVDFLSAPLFLRSKEFSLTDRFSTHTLSPRTLSNLPRIPLS